MNRVRVITNQLAPSSSPSSSFSSSPSSSSDDQANAEAIKKLTSLAQQHGLDIKGGKIRRTSSRFCFGVEHGDYNGTELFGVGTNRFIWLAYKPNQSGKVRIFSANFPESGVVEFSVGKVPPPLTEKDSWSRFAFGADWVLRTHQKLNLTKGFDAVVYGNIPGGGMSRSASISINLILTMLEINQLQVSPPFRIVELAQKLENDYIGSPCGQLDQIMILFAKKGQGTHFNPKTKEISYVPFGGDSSSFSIVVMDTGTVRPGLEKSTYKVRRGECDKLVETARKNGFNISCLGDIKDVNELEAMAKKLGAGGPLDRAEYIFHAQRRFYDMLAAWRKGDIQTVGSLFRLDGHGLRDLYSISGPELESMCDIVRTVPGVLGERMLGGGDKGAAGCLVVAGSESAVANAVRTAYPRAHPKFATAYAVHSVQLCDGVTVFNL